MRRSIIWFIGPMLAAALLAACVSEGGNQNINAEDSARYNATLGKSYAESGRHDLAMDKLNKAKAANPDLPEVYVGFAELYARLGQPKLADENWQKALDLDPTRSDLFNNYGLYLCEKGQFDQAEQQFLKAIANPNYTAPEYAHTNAGICAIKRGDTAKGMRYLRKALEFKPNFGPALWVLINQVYKYKQYQQTILYLERYHSASRPTPDSLLIGLRAERVLGNRQNAAQYRQQLITMFPNSPQAAEAGSER